MYTVCIKFIRLEQNYADIRALYQNVKCKIKFHSFFLQYSFDSRDKAGGRKPGGEQRTVQQSSPGGLQTGTLKLHTMFTARLYLYFVAITNKISATPVAQDWLGKKKPWVSQN